MKSFFGRTCFVVLVFTVILSSCTEDYSEINTNKNTIGKIGPAEIPFLFSAALTISPNFLWNYQVAQGLFSDQYAQYFACTASYFPTDKYTIVDSWLTQYWRPIYVNAAPQLQEILIRMDPNSAEYAMASIWWVFTFHRMTDYWGPIPYFSVGESGSTVPYSPQDSIYYDFFKRLKTSVEILKNHTSEQPYGSFDIMYGGDVNKWIKFANTLRLRLAIRISNVEPDRAKIEGEEAFQSGLLENSPDDDALVLRSNNFEDGHGLGLMSEWNEYRMSATMESILKGYNDPRISEYFLPAKSSETYEGLRNGLSTTQLGFAKNKINTNSHHGPRWTNPVSGGRVGFLGTSQNIMCSAEAYFLRAEGALLGWDMGASAQSCYEDGIRNSMIQWGYTDNAVVDAYINGITLPIAPGDYLNSPPVTDVPVLFNTTDIDIQKEQISIQKWLALYPDGHEAWADNRRSRAFKLYPVANSENPDITDPTTQWIRRITFILDEKISNGPAVEQAVQLLNGPDKISTPLWWDKN